MTATIIKVNVKMHNVMCMPTYATDGSAGMDLKAYTQVPVTIHPGSVFTIPTGLFVEIPDGYYGQIRPRSSGFRRGLVIDGTIDSDYRGEINIVIWNIGPEDEVIEPLERIAQMIIQPMMRCQLNVVNSLTPTKRNQGGFGHTGK